MAFHKIYCSRHKGVLARKGTLLAIFDHLNEAGHHLGDWAIMSNFGTATDTNIAKYEITALKGDSDFHELRPRHFGAGDLTREMHQALGFVVPFRGVESVSMKKEKEL